MFDDGAECVIKNEIEDRFGSPQYEVGLELNRLTYEAQVLADLATRESDPHKRREFAYMAVLKSNISMLELASLTGETDIRLWRFPEDISDGNNIYIASLPSMIDRLSKNQVIRVARYFDESFPRSLKKQVSCEQSKLAAIFVSLLSVVLAVGAILWGHKRDREAGSV